MTKRRRRAVVLNIQGHEAITFQALLIRYAQPQKVVFNHAYFGTIKIKFTSLSKTKSGKPDKDPLQGSIIAVGIVAAAIYVSRIDGSHTVGIQFYVHGLTDGYGRIGILKDVFDITAAGVIRAAAALFGAT